MKYQYFSRTFEFNDVVACTATMLPSCDSVGRLVQVRKEIGAFGSDMYFIRLADGRLHTFENVGLVHADEEIDAHEGDSPEREYTIKGKYPETGFIVEKPNQPRSPSPDFCIAITQAKASAATSESKEPE